MIEAQRALSQFGLMGTLAACLLAGTGTQARADGGGGGSGDAIMNLRIRELEDIEEIKELKARYGYAVDAALKDPTKTGDITKLMTDDIVADYGAAGTYTGKAQVTNYFRNVVPLQVAWGFHMALNPVIRVTGATTATGAWYVYALGVYKSAYAAGPQPVYGRYEETYVRTFTGWKIKTLTLYVDTPPTGP